MATANISIDFASKSDINNGTAFKSVNPSVLKTALTDPTLSFGYGLGDVVANNIGSNTTATTLLSASSLNSANLTTSSIISPATTSSILSAQKLRTTNLNSAWLRFGRVTSAFENCSAGALANYHRDLRGEINYPATYSAGRPSEKLVLQISYTSSNKAEYLIFSGQYISGSTTSPMTDQHYTIYESATNLGALGSAPPGGATRIIQQNAGFSFSYGDANPCVDGRLIAFSLPGTNYYPIPAAKRGMTRYYGVYGTLQGSSCGWSNSYAAYFNVTEVIYTDVANIP